MYLSPSPFITNSIPSTNKINPQPLKVQKYKQKILNPLPSVPNINR